MRVKVESVFTGHTCKHILSWGGAGSPYSYSRLVLAHRYWDRHAVRDALWNLETLYGIPRRNVRFDTTLAN